MPQNKNNNNNNTMTHKKPTFLPRLRKSRRVDYKIGDQYYAALKEAVFSMNNPYVPAEPPENVKNNFPSSAKYFRCEQCNDSFRFAHTFEDHKTRRCWILGYWCVQCYAPPCTHKKDTTCRYCSALEEKKRLYLRSRGLTKNQKPATVKIFYNQCQFFEHLKKHNVASPESDDLMLMPLPGSISKSDYPKLDHICSPMFERMFLLKTHVSDWLKSHNIQNNWWKLNDSDSSISYLLEGYRSEAYFDDVFETLMQENQSGAESSDDLCPPLISLDSSEDKVLPDNRNSPQDIAFVDCGPTPKTYIMNTKKRVPSMPVKVPLNVVPSASVPKISVKKFATDQTWKHTSEPKLAPKLQKPAGAPNLIPINSVGGMLQGQKLNTDTKILTVRGPKGVNLTTLIKQLPQDVINNKKIVFVGQQTLDKPSGLKVPADSKATTYKSIMPAMYDNTKPRFIRILPSPTNPISSTKMSEMKINGMSVKTMQNNGQVFVKKRTNIVPPVKVKSANIANTITRKDGVSLVDVKPSNGEGTVQNFFSVEQVLKHIKTDFTGESLETYEHPTRGWILRSAAKPKSMKNVQTVYRYRQKMLQNLETLSTREIKKYIDHFKVLDKRCRQTISSKMENVSLGHGQMIRILENALDKAEARLNPVTEVVIDEEYENYLNKWEMGLHLHEMRKCDVCKKVCKPDRYIFGMSQESRKSVLYCSCNEYICYKCNLYQGSNPRFKAHLEYHRKDENNVCPECFQKFDGYKELAVHLWTSCFHILTRRLLGCTVCQIGGFENEEALARHFATVHMTKAVTCSKCLKVFRTHAECKEHQKEHMDQFDLHVVKILVCDVGDCVVDPKLFRSHMSSHLGTQKLIYYKCPVCSAYIKDSGRGKEVVKLHLYVYHLDKLSEIIEKDVLTEIISSGVPDMVRASDENAKKDKRKDKFRPKIVQACSITSEAFDSANERSDFKMESDSNSEVVSTPTSSKDGKKKKKKSQKPGRIALNGPSSSKNNEAQDYKCHLCGVLINTSWSVIQEHFQTSHSDTYKLSILTPKLLRISNEFIERGYQEYVSKKRKTEPMLSPSKRKKRWTPKKNSDSMDKLSGICVTPESSGDNSCKKCDTRFETMTELRKHIAASHRIKGMYLICLECGDNFIVAPSLQMHLKAFHGIEDPIGYLDENPLYAAEAVDDMEEKMKTVVDNQCHVCMAVFEDKVAVDKHLRVHGMAFLNKKRIEARKAMKSPEIEKEAEQDEGIKMEVEEEKSDEINE